MSGAADASWELSKENARPLKLGYNMTGLSSLLDAKDAPGKNKELEEMKAFVPLVLHTSHQQQLRSTQHDLLRHHEAKILANGDEDPLKAWKEYIRWSEDAGVSSALKVDRAALLERCVTRFRDYKQYQNDQRYFRICLKYADTRQDPREVFEFMQGWGIGLLFTKFWMCWAYVLENQGRFEEADAILEQGRGHLSVNHKDVEVQELMEIQKEFRERAAVAAEAAKKGADAREQEASARQRLALGEVKKTSRGTARVSRAPIPNRGGLAPRRSATTVSGGSSNFTILADAPDQAPPSSSTAPAVWQDLPTEATTSKENVRAAGQWKRGVGTKAKPTAQIGFQIFSEPDVQDSSAAAPAKPSFRQGFERRAALGEYKPPPNVQLLKDYARDRGTSRHVDGMYLGYDPAPLFGTTEEMSFEEMRAIRYFEKQDELAVEAEAARVRAEAAALAEAEAAAAAAAMEVEDAENQPPPPSEMDQDCDSSMTDKTISRHLSFHSTTTTQQIDPVIDAAVASSGGMPSPTINTKEAMSEIFTLFGNGSVMDTSSSIDTGSRIAVHEDTNPEVVEDMENQPPASYQQPRVTVAAEQADKHSTGRRVLGEVPGMALEPYHDEAQPETMDSSEPIPTAETLVSRADSKPVGETFGDIMKNLGLEIPDRSAAGQIVPQAVTVPDFQIFEDPPTGRVIENSFSHSTPFSSTAAPGAKPVVTPIDHAKSMIKPNSEPQCMEAEGEASEVELGTRTTELSPIMEASHESSMMTDASSFRTSSTTTPSVPESGNWPLTAEAKQQALDTMDFSEWPHCTIDLENGPPQIAPNSVISLMSQDISLSVVGEEHRGEMFVARDDTKIANDDPNQSTTEAQQQFIVSTPLPWEYALLYKVSQKTKKCPKHLRGALRSLPKLFACDIYSTAAVTVITHTDEYSLGDIVAMQTKTQKSMDETLVMFYAIELLRVVGTLHGAGVVHCGIDANTIKLRNEEDEGEWAVQYSPAGDGSWDGKGILLTNFRNSVDVDALDGGQLVGPAGALPRHLQGRGWTVELDYYGILDVLHQLLFSTPMDITLDESTGRYRPSAKFARFWQKNLWGPLFDQLLNSEGRTDLAKLRVSFEQFLASNPFKAKSLRQALIKQDFQLFENRS